MYCTLEHRDKEQAPGKMVGGNFLSIFSKAISNDSSVLELPCDHSNSNKNHLVTGLDCRLRLALADLKSSLQSFVTKKTVS